MVKQKISHQEKIEAALGELKNIPAPVALKARIKNRAWSKKGHDTFRWWALAPLTAAGLMLFMISSNSHVTAPQITLADSELVEIATDLNDDTTIFEENNDTNYLSSYLTGQQDFL